jgi:hypothetical protein
MTDLQWWVGARKDYAHSTCRGMAADAVQSARKLNKRLNLKNLAAGLDVHELNALLFSL